MNAVTEIRPSMIGALAKALASVEGAQRNAENPHFKSSYADMASVIAAIRPVAEHGIWYRQVPKRDPDGVVIETFYIHESGDEMSAGETFMPVNKRDPQGFGSASTYCRRYSLQTAFGIASEDDDAEAAMRGAGRRDGGGRPRNNQQQQQQDNHRGGRDSEGMPDAAWSKLASLLQATNTAPAVLCEHYRVKDLRKLGEQQYVEAIDRLEQRLAEAAKAETNRTATGTDLADDEIPY